MPPTDEQRRQAARDRRRDQREKRLERQKPPEEKPAKPDETREEKLERRAEKAEGENEGLRAELRTERENAKRDLRVVQKRNTQLTKQLEKREDVSLRAKRVVIPDIGVGVILPDGTVPGDILMLPSGGRYKVGDDGVSLYHVGSF